MVWLLALIVVTANVHTVLVEIIHFYSVTIIQNVKHMQKSQIQFLTKKQCDHELNLIQLGAAMEQFMQCGLEEGIFPRKITMCRESGEAGVKV